MAYSDKENVNILTALLVKHGVRHAVVCPGSRNAPIVHDLCECPEIECYSVTDERSAGFVALGMTQAENEPVALCVTSGTALLNTLPAVAEAYYQHRPIVVISADRPASMIGQLQGQTLMQPGALGRFVKKMVTLNTSDHWYCNRLVNEALMAMRQHGEGPVHINVPMDEPLFNFTHKELSDERVVRLHQSDYDLDAVEEIARDFCKAERPMIVIGQMKGVIIGGAVEEMKNLRQSVVVLQEKLSDDLPGEPCHFDEALTVIGDNADYEPDFVVYMGETLVSKRAKYFLQRCNPRRTVIVNETGQLADITMHATDVLECNPYTVLCAIEEKYYKREPSEFYNRWKTLLDSCAKHCREYLPEYSQMLAVKTLHEAIKGTAYYLQYGNSTAVRLGQLYSHDYIFCNRGVNGIEGSLSTAVGFASLNRRRVYCVIGDLSFFYDQNGLWNELPKNNLRILLLNNGGGGIFHQLPGLSASPYRDRYVAAAHHSSAEGTCRTAGVEYKAVKEERELASGIEWLKGGDTVRLLEVFTDAETDALQWPRLSAGHQQY